MQQAGARGGGRVQRQVRRVQEVIVRVHLCCRPAMAKAMRRAVPMSEIAKAIVLRGPASAAGAASRRFEQLLGASRPRRGGVYALWPAGVGGEAGSQALVYVELPTGYDPSREHAVVLLLPGGGFYSISRGVATCARQFARERGYVAVWLAYRTYADCVPLQAMLADAGRCVQSLRALAPRWGLATSPMLVCGFSAGARLASLLVVREAVAEALGNAAPGLADEASGQSWAPDVLFLHYGSYDERPDVDHDYEARALRLNPDAARWRWGFPQRWRATLRHVKGGTWPPTLVTHGVKDWLLEVSCSRELVEKLKAAGVPHLYLEYAEEGHGYMPGARTPLSGALSCVERLWQSFELRDRTGRNDVNVSSRQWLFWLFNCVLCRGSRGPDWMPEGLRFMQDAVTANASLSRVE